MFQRGWFWLDVSTSLRIESLIKPYGVVRRGELVVAPSVIAEQPGRWAGLIAEVSFAELEQLRELRHLAPMLPVLALVNVGSPVLVNALQAMGIEVVVWPIDARGIVAFVQRAFATAFLPDDRLSRLVQDLAQRAGLTARELQLLAFCLGNEPRERVRKRLGIKENTLKTQVKGLLRKCKARNVDALAKNLLRAALLMDKPEEVRQSVAQWLPRADAA
jgi:DNA-binding NarL/FixJ family response regulator